MSAEQIIVVANVISFIGNALFTSSSLFRSKKKIIALQTSCHLLNGTAEFMRKAYSGLSQDGVMLVKNIVLLFVDEARKHLKLAINILCIITALTLGILFNIFLSNNIWYGYFPVLGMFVYSICSTTVFVKEGLSKNATELILKIALIFNGICQCAYGIFVKLYPNTIFNGITIVVSIVSIVRIAVSVHKMKKEEKIENNVTNEE